VTLTATNSCGSDVATKVDYITVTCTSPVADFSGTPVSGCASLTVDFTDLSTGNPTSWDWDFGDGAGSSSAQNPSYIYDSPGCYTVTLTVSNSCGSDATTKVDYICVDECGPDKVYPNSEVTVAGIVSGDFTNTFASDNIYESISEIEYTNHPRKRSSYLEHKWMIDVGGGGSSMMFYVEGYRPDNAEGDNFVFAYSTDDVTYNDMVTIASASEQVYSYSLPAGITGTVYIRVVDTDLSWGNTSMDAVFVDEMYIEFSSTPGPPVANFVGAPTSGQPPLTVDFTDLSTGNPDTWYWDFGDGVGTSSSQNPSYTYNSIGSYTVTLMAGNAYGSDSEVKTGYINVTEAGNTVFVYDMSVGREKVTAYYYGSCTVYIYDNNNNPVSGATVYVTATGPTGGSYNGVTGADGSVFFQTDTGLKKPSGEWCFEVTDVTHASYTYDPGSNNVTQMCESGMVYSTKSLASDGMPEGFSLSNNPNPFNPTTTLYFDLPHDSHVKLEIYNILGQRVETLVDQYLPAGSYSYEWNGSTMASGIYLYSLTTDSGVYTRKMTLMK
jgi:PKD repeat protein